jgi:chaperonin cofactor prefoldin
MESKLQEASQDFQKLQVDLARAVEARQQIDAQLSENEQVKKVLIPINCPQEIDGWHSGICAT